jgi:hypothetical protein
LTGFRNLFACHDPASGPVSASPSPITQATSSSGVVERGAIGVRQRVAELAALVDRAGGLRRRVAGDAAREGELAEQGTHALGVVGDVGVALRVRALQVRRGHHRRAAVPRAADVESVEVVATDHAVEVRPEGG